MNMVEPSDFKSIALDFAEFASTLISETLNATVASMLTQERQILELEQQTMLSPEEYAKDNLTEELIKAEILRQFPSTDGEKSSVDIGEPYTPPINADESPSIYKKTGYTMTPNDVNRISHISMDNRDKSNSEQKWLINEAGYNHIYAATRLTLAVQHLSMLKQIIRRGIPRVHVNTGHIKSKMVLSFEIKEHTNTQKTTGSKIIETGIRKLRVQPVTNTIEYLTLNADILSEVEITFKTVIP